MIMFENGVGDDVMYPQNTPVSGGDLQRLPILAESARRCVDGCNHSDVSAAPARSRASMPGSPVDWADGSAHALNERRTYQQRWFV